jgi:hypothetical protein
MCSDFILLVDTDVYMGIHDSGEKHATIFAELLPVATVCKGATFISRPARILLDTTQLIEGCLHGADMAKSKNHTAHNQTYKAHKNGIKKPRKQRYSSRKGVRGMQMPCVVRCNDVTSGQALDNSRVEVFSSDVASTQLGCSRPDGVLFVCRRWTLSSCGTR